MIPTTQAGLAQQALDAQSGQSMPSPEEEAITYDQEIMARAMAPGEGAGMSTMPDGGTHVQMPPQTITAGDGQAPIPSEGGTDLHLAETSEGLNADERIKGRTAEMAGRLSEGGMSMPESETEVAAKAATEQTQRETVAISDAKQAENEKDAATLDYLNDRQKKDEIHIEAQAAGQTAYDDLKELNMAAIKDHNEQNIDPNRAMQGFGNSVLAGVAIMLGGFGAGLAGGPNQGLMAVQKAIARDVKAQLADKESGRQAIGAQQRLMDDIRAQGLSRQNEYKFATGVRELQFISTMKPLVARIQAPAVRMKQQQDLQDYELSVQKKQADIAKTKGEAAKLEVETGEIPLEGQSKRLYRIGQLQTEEAKLAQKRREFEFDAQMKMMPKGKDSFNIRGYETYEGADASTLGDKQRTKAYVTSIAYKGFLQAREQIASILEDDPTGIARRTMGSKTRAQLSVHMFNISTAVGRMADAGVIGQIEREEMLKRLGNIDSDIFQINSLSSYEEGSAMIRNAMRGTLYTYNLHLKGDTPYTEDDRWESSEVGRGRKGSGKPKEELDLQASVP